MQTFFKFLIGWTTGSKKPSRRPKRKPSSCTDSLVHYAQLEPRQMLATVTYDAGVLSVFGTESIDRITVRETDTTVNVFSEEGLIREVSENVHQLKFYGGDGNDRFANLTGIPTQFFGGAGNDTFEGGSGDDLAYGARGQDTLRGNDGNDRIYGGQWQDTIFGGDGDDSLFGGDGGDEIYGEMGNDFIVGHTGSDQIWGGNGDDRIRGGSDHDTINGNDGDDTIFGGPGDDRLRGNGDEDRIFGGSGNYWIAGNDTIEGGDHDDQIFGFAGDDVIFGNDGDDLIYGGHGADQISGGHGDDLIYAQADDDTVYGNEGNDFLRGGDGDDLIFGDGGSDGVYGEDGDDQLFARFSGEVRANQILGGDGNDTLAGTSADRIRGERGLDRYLESDSVYYFTHKAPNEISIKFSQLSHDYSHQHMAVVDDALQRLFDTTGNNTLLLNPSTGEPIQIRLVDWLEGEPVSAANYTNRFPHNDVIVATSWDTTNPQLNERVQREFVSKIAWQWSLNTSLTALDPSFNGRIAQFNQLSSWQKDTPEAAGFGRSLDGRWWFDQSVEFHDYRGKFNPQSDLGSVWEIYVFDQSPVGVYGADVDAKLQWVDELMDDLRAR